MLRTIKILSLMALLAFTSLWLLTCRYDMTALYRTLTLSAADGEIDLYINTWPDRPLGWVVTDASSFNRPGPGLPRIRRYSSSTEVRLPIWLGAFLSFISTAFLLRCSRPRLPMRICFDCGYNWRGITSARCPECGGWRAAIARRTSKARRIRVIEKSVWTGALSIGIFGLTVVLLGLLPGALTLGAADLAFPGLFDAEDMKGVDVAFVVMLGVYSVWLAVSVIAYVCFSKRLFRRLVRWEIS